MAALLCGVATANEPSANGSGAESTGNLQAGGTNSPPTIKQPSGLPSTIAANQAINSGKKAVGASSKPPLAIDKQTTFILKPLLPDGYPDYFAALNDYCRGPATPDTNAAVLLVEAFGPELVPPAIRDQYFALLGLGALPSDGRYFVRSSEMVERWAKATPQLVEAEQPDALQGQFTSAGIQPWSINEYPMVAEWLAINDASLRLITTASRRANFYEPIVSPSQNLPALYSVTMPMEQALGEMAIALQARAMLFAKSGNVDAALDDLITCHRWLRFMGAVPLGQYAVETRTSEISLCQVELKILHCCHPSLKQVERMKTELAALPPLSSLADRINLADRFRYLDTVCLLDKKGSGALKQLFGEMSLTAEESALQKATSDLLFDWNEPLRMGNEWFDRQTAVYRMTNRPEREKALEKLHEDLEQMSTDAAKPGMFVLNWFTKRSAKAAISRIVGASLLQLFDNEAPGILNIDDQLELHLAFTQTGTALAAYHADNGEYPEQLDSLVPKYIAQLPHDLYDDQSPLHYRRESSGYLLYSVGSNGRDEHAGMSDSFSGSDDISVLVTDASMPETDK
jgi:hypothetical protein